MHTPADCSSSQASWGPRALPYVLASKTSSGLSSGLFYESNFAKIFSFKYPMGGQDGTAANKRVTLSPKSSLDPGAHSCSVRSIEVISTSRSFSATPCSHEFTTQPTLPTRKPIFQKQPKNLTFALPRSSACCAGSSAGPEGEGGLPACRSLPQKRSARRHTHVLGAVSVAALL